MKNYSTSKASISTHNHVSTMCIQVNFVMWKYTPVHSRAKWSVLNSGWEPLGPRSLHTLLPILCHLWHSLRQCSPCNFLKLIIAAGTADAADSMNIRRSHVSTQALKRFWCPSLSDQQKLHAQCLQCTLNSKFFPIQDGVRTVAQWVRIYCGPVGIQWERHWLIMAFDVRIAHTICMLNRVPLLTVRDLTLIKWNRMLAAAPALENGQERLAVLGLVLFVPFVGVDWNLSCHLQFEALLSNVLIPQDVRVSTEESGLHRQRSSTRANVESNYYWGKSTGAVFASDEGYGQARTRTCWTGTIMSWTGRHQPGGDDHQRVGLLVVFGDDASPREVQDIAPQHKLRIRENLRPLRHRCTAGKYSVLDGLDQLHLCGKLRANLADCVQPNEKGYLYAIVAWERGHENHLSAVAYLR